MNNNFKILGMRIPTHNGEIVRNNSKSKRLCNQARLDSAQHGDTNSKFFHAIIKGRCQRQVIQVQRSDGQFTTDAKGIGILAEQFYGDLFSSTPYHLDESLFAQINAKVTDKENSKLCAIHSIEEVFTVIKLIDPTSSPGNDGFTGSFY